MRDKEHRININLTFMQLHEFEKLFLKQEFLLFTFLSSCSHFFKSTLQQIDDTKGNIFVFCKFILYSCECKNFQRSLDCIYIYYCTVLNVKLLFCRVHLSQSKLKRMYICKPLLLREILFYNSSLDLRVENKSHTLVPQPRG